MAMKNGQPEESHQPDRERIKKGAAAILDSMMTIHDPDIAGTRPFAEMLRQEYPELAPVVFVSGQNDREVKLLERAPRMASMLTFLKQTGEATPAILEELGNLRELVQLHEDEFRRHAKSEELNDIKAYRLYSAIQDDYREVKALVTNLLEELGKGRHSSRQH